MEVALEWILKYQQWILIISGVVGIVAVVYVAQLCDRIGLWD